MKTYCYMCHGYTMHENDTCLKCGNKREARPFASVDNPHLPKVNPPYDTSSRELSREVEEECGCVGTCQGMCEKAHKEQEDDGYDECPSCGTSNTYDGYCFSCKNSFDEFGSEDNGPTGHGDICYSDADNGL